MPLIGTEGHCIIWIYCNFCFVANELIKVSWLISYAYCVGCCSCSCGRALQLNKNKDNTYSHISKHKPLFVLHKFSEQLHIVILFMTFHKFSVNSGRLSSMSYAVYCWNSPKGLSLQTVWAYFPPAKPVFHLSATDAPTATSTNNGSTSTSQNNNDLDVFGPMVSNPLPASTSAAQFSQVKPRKESLVHIWY